MGRREGIALCCFGDNGSARMNTKILSFTYSNVQYSRPFVLSGNA